MAVELPRAPPGLMPNSHGIVAKHNRLLANVDFGDILDPHELVLDFPNHAVMIPQYKVDPLATNRLPISQRDLGSTYAKIAQEVEFIFRLDAFVDASKNFLVHFTGTCERASTVANDIGVSEMEVGCEPDHEESSLYGCEFSRIHESPVLVLPKRFWRKMDH